MGIEKEEIHAKKPASIEAGRIFSNFECYAD